MNKNAYQPNPASSFDDLSTERKTLNDEQMAKATAALNSLKELREIVGG